MIVQGQTYRVVDSLAQSPSFLFFHIFLAVHLVNELLELDHVCFLPQPSVLRMLSIPVATEQFAITSVGIQSLV